MKTHDEYMEALAILLGRVEMSKTELEWNEAFDEFERMTDVRVEHDYSRRMFGRFVFMDEPGTPGAEVYH